MQTSPELLFKRLHELGIDFKIHKHPPAFTVEQAKTHCSHLPGGHCKNLFLKDKKGDLWLVVTLDEQNVDMKSLRKLIGSSHLSFGKHELLNEVLGVEPGSVTPFALINDQYKQVKVILDKNMMEKNLLNYHPLTNNMTVTITPTDLITFIHNTGHNPSLISF